MSNDPTPLPPAPTTKPWYTSLQTWLGIVLIVLPIVQEILTYISSQDVNTFMDPNKALMVIAGVIAIVLRATSTGKKLTL